MTDQCAAQFRSQFVLQNLLNVNRNVSPRLQNVQFNYFQSHEGINFSDTIGAIAKQAFNRAKSCASTQNDGVGAVDSDADQEMVICEQVKQLKLSGLNFENGKLGDFAFFR